MAISVTFVPLAATTITLMNTNMHPTRPFEIQQPPYIALAPMEGLMDHKLRELLTSVGGIDHCVTEFVRVSHTLYPARVFYKYCPELLQGGKTLAGTPVHVQLLGSDPVLLAENAARVAELGAPAIDLNFGCPAKTVNRSRGGAVLLQDTELLHEITSAVRRAVPSHIPVSAKMRLGYFDKSMAIDNACALADAGIQWLTVHARTKVEGYKPPAHWQWIDKIRQAVSIDVIANGEIWTKDDAFRCKQVSGSDLLMIGRGLVATPDLGLQIKSHTSGIPYTKYKWTDNLALFYKLAEQLDYLTDKQLTDRLKQWLHYFALFSPQMKEVFDQAKKHREKDAFFAALNAVAGKEEE